MSSIIGGKINARAELLKDPTKDITADKFGMAAAKATVKHKYLKTQKLYICRLTIGIKSKMLNIKTCTHVINTTYMLMWQEIL